ncbi:hypothetical protein F4860DRAFT_509521 [Xylaria cubensis]|nr:hypothetical protein F4860DRAFT_509521 [Xylaria cubensis]
METPVGREAPLSLQDYRRKARELEREARDAISTSRTWNFERLLGHGSSGVAMLLVERDLLRSHRPRRAVLKLPLETAGGDDDLIREAQALDVLRGHAHIAQRISFTQDVSSFQPTVVSACVAMTYKRGGPENRHVDLEAPQRDHEHLRLIHNDIAFRNVVMDDIDPLVQEHRATPKLVLIDFGMARQALDARDAENDNLEAVNMLMLDLIDPSMNINNQGFYPIESTNGFRTMAAGLFNKARLPLLDPELQTLLAHSFRIGDNGQPFRRLSLEDTFRRTRRGMLKPAESYNARVRESDDFIWAQLQRLLYDADAEW